MIEAKVIKDSISEQGKRITTLQVKFHRFILPEFNTHRVFSRNFSSSRAIPTSKLLDQVAKDPAMPVFWGKNQPGMQAAEEMENKYEAEVRWREAAQKAANVAARMAELGCHKQTVNRIIEPYLWAQGIITSTEFSNFFELRDHEDAQPEIRELAIRMREAMNNSSPTLLRPGQWHLPYISEEDANDSFFSTPENKWLLHKISAARCCRVSYLKHDGSVPNLGDDLALFARLANSVPIHASPLEHQAAPDDTNEIGGFSNPSMHGNLHGWIQFRKYWEQHMTYAARHGDTVGKLVKEQMDANSSS
jgi:hypothetical protein